MRPPTAGSSRKGMKSRIKSNEERLNIFEAIFQQTQHRPWPMPEKRWIWYQEWNRVVLLHWKVPVSIIRTLVPEVLEIDTIGGDAWVSVVPFTMNRIRPRGLPAVPIVSDFDEVNLRTYVTDGKKNGVYFLSIQAQKVLSVMIAKGISGLPYEKAEISRSTDGDLDSYRLRNSAHGLKLDASYQIKDEIVAKTDLDRWLTERYCLYAGTSERLYRYEIHHREWPLRNIRVDQLNHNYRVGEELLSKRVPDLCHYSPGVQVVAWKRERIKGY